MWYFEEDDIVLRIKLHGTLKMVMLYFEEGAVWFMILLLCEWAMLHSCFFIRIFLLECHYWWTVCVCLPAQLILHIQQ